MPRRSSASVSKSTAGPAGIRAPQPRVVRSAVAARAAQAGLNALPEVCALAALGALPSPAFVAAPQPPAIRLPQSDEAARVRRSGDSSAARRPVTSSGGDIKRRVKNAVRTPESLALFKGALKATTTETKKITLGAAVRTFGVSLNDLKKLRPAIEALTTLQSQLAAIAAFEWPVQGNQSRKIFTRDERAFIYETVRYFGEMGMPFTDGTLGELASTMAFRMNKKDPHTGDFPVCGPHWVDILMKEFHG